MAENVRYTRVLESFDDFCSKEIVYCGLMAAILWFEKHDAENSILGTLGNALQHRLTELKEHYDSQKYRERL